MKALVEGGEVVEALKERILGRVLAIDLLHPETQDAAFPAGTLLDEEAVDTIDNVGIDEVKVRTPLTCATRWGPAFCAATTAACRRTAAFSTRTEAFGRRSAAKERHSERRPEGPKSRNRDRPDRGCPRAGCLRFLTAFGRQQASQTRINGCSGLD